MSGAATAAAAGPSASSASAAETKGLTLPRQISATIGPGTREAMHRTAAMASRNDGLHLGGTTMTLGPSSADCAVELARNGAATGAICGNSPRPAAAADFIANTNCRNHLPTNSSSAPPSSNGVHASSTNNSQQHQQNHQAPSSATAKRSGSTCSSSSTLSSTFGAPALAQRFFAAIPPSGTPLDAQFHCLQAAGQMVGAHWHHFTAQATVGNDKEASVLLFDKKCNVKGPARLGRINRLGLADLLRYELQQLQQLVHPRIVRLLHPLAENKEMLAFASEPMQCTLDKLFEQFSETEDGGAPLEKLEMKLGVLQLIEGLSYLHNNVKMLHGNLTPQAIFLTAHQHWKIGGFAFSVSPKKPNTFPCFPWTKKLPACLQPDLDFLAPEYLAPNTQTVTTAADVFSLGAMICWIYAGGKRLIDVKNNLESYQIVIDQLDVALDLLDSELGPNLKGSLSKVLSKEVELRPAVQMLALTKHFDDPALGALRQLDDLAQEFDPANKANFLSQTLCSLLPQIPESLWFRRVLRRFNEHLPEAQELFVSLLRPLSYMLQHCESHNIHRLRPWFRRIIAKTEDKALCQGLLDQMPVIFRRLSDEQVEDRCFDLLIQLLQGQDPHLKQNAVRTLPQIVDFIPGWFVNKRLIPVLQSQAQFFQEHIPRQIDLLVAIAHLSDRCDAPTLHYLLTVASVCSTLHPAIVHSKSRLVQRILTCDVSRLRDPLIIAHHLLNPLVLGLALPEMSPAHFDDVMSSSRILLDIIEQLRYESDDSRMKENNGRRLCNRRVSMSSNHLPRLLITAARPSIGGDGRKMSFLSADGRLEDRSSRRESKDSRCSLESEVSLRIYNGSDISDESALGSSVGGGGTGPGAGIPTMGGGGGRQFRRKSWLEGYMHSVSLEQQGPASGGASLLHHHHPPPFSTNDVRANSAIGCRGVHQHHQQQQQIHQTLLEQRPFSTLVRKLPSPKDHQLLTTTNVNRTHSPESDQQTGAKPIRPNSFTNLGHNLACTLWKTFY